MGEYYKIEVYLPAGSDDVKNALVSSGIRTDSVTEVKGIDEGRTHRMSDIVRGKFKTDSPVKLEVVVGTEELARRVVDLIRLNATTGNPGVEYTRMDYFQPPTE